MLEETKFDETFVHIFTDALHHRWLFYGQLR